ncbi:MAG: HD domain-containing protein [Sulfuritalea sp.]|nr:HD domain-containing protein [Sulfuritalea sp.]
MIVETDVPVLDELLVAHREIIGADFAAYRNHCFRVFNFCVAMADANEAERERFAIATAFHDLGIWSARSFDYLAPSKDLARDYLKASGRTPWIDEVTAMIGNHHKITCFQRCRLSLVEVFRRADWIDVSMGRLSFGVPRAFIRKTLASFPNAGFHRMLLAMIWRRTMTHPLSPLPMMRL